MKIPITILAVLVILLGGTAGGFFWWRAASAPGPYDDFAKCLGEKGLKFYGAYWCPHCLNQKKLFGKSAKYLPYIECAIPGSEELKQDCREKGVKGFPTWTGLDNWRAEGEIDLATLAERSGCALEHQAP
ncbi:hypothetical protein EPN90_02310 [Patescibacteria group bacterium]|nr:MAG: hypothetical protein EPN90_02310 [Patescibacteria group bacterium]